MYYYEFAYDYMSFNGNFLLSFLDMYPQVFVPDHLFGEKNNFSDISRNEINAENFKFRGVLISSKDKEMLMAGSISQNFLQPRKFRSHIIFTNKINLLTNEEREYFTQHPSFKIGFEENQEYHNCQSDDNPQIYYPHDNFHEPLSEKALKKYPFPIYFNENIQLYRIDISNNPGRERFLPGMKFIPAYKIWFGKEAQELFGKRKILNYPKSIYNRELANGIIEIQLMDDVTKCDQLYNQEKQKDIVKYLDIEKIEVRAD
jgi:hypothetical protein